MSLSLLLVDDHEIVRRALADMLTDDPRFVVVGQAGSIADTAACVDRLVEAGTTVDVAIVDVRLGDGDALDVMAAVAERVGPTPVVVLTAFDDDEAIVRATDAGAAGFVLKSARVEALTQAVSAAAVGGSLIDPARVALARRRLGRRPAVDELSDRERQVFDLIGHGHSNREIADRLGLAEKTVKNYTSSMLMKLGLSRRTEVAALAARLEHPDVVRLHLDRATGMGA